MNTVHDHKTLFSCSDDHSVRRWNLHKNTGEELYTHTGLVYGLDLSRDNGFIISCCSSGEIKLYWLLESKEIFSHRHEESVMWCVKISAKNLYFAAGDDKAQIFLYGFLERKLLRVLKGHTNRVRCLDIAGNEKFLVSGGIDNMIKVWNLETNKDESTIYGHSDWVKAVIISNDNSEIYSMSDDCRIMTSKVPDFANHVNVPVSSTILRFILNPKDKILYALNDLHQIITFSHKKLPEVFVEVYRPVLDLCITNSGTKLAVALVPALASSVEIMLIEMYGTRRTTSFNFKTDSLATSVVMSEEGDLVVIGETYRVTVHGLISGEKTTFRTHTCEVTALAIEKGRVYAGDAEGIIKFYELKDRFHEAGIMADDKHSKVTSIKLRSHHKMIFSATENGQINIWSSEKHTRINKLNFHAPIKDIHFTANGLHMFINTTDRLYIQNRENLSSCTEITLSEPNVSIGFTSDESEIYLSFPRYNKILENPLKTQKISIYGDQREEHRFVEYVLKIMNDEMPKHSTAFDNWLIEPFHINALHLYAYYNLHKHLDQAITHRDSFSHLVQVIPQCLSISIRSSQSASTLFSRT